MHRCHSRVVLAGCALLALGCDAANPFRTDAAYEAPTGGFRVHVHATGFVPAGADLADSSTGTAWICPARDDVTTRRAITLSVHGSPRAATYSVAPADAGAPTSTGAWRWNAGQLTALLADAGYSDVPPDEVRETIRVLGALQGPKAMVLQGQSKALTVVRAEYAYGRGATRDTSAASPCP